MENIKQEISAKGGSFYYEQDGARLAEMVYTMAGDRTLIIDHTEVDDSLRGRGVGKALLAALVTFVRAQRIEVIPLCPFANALFQKVKEWQDVLAPISIRHKAED